MTVSSEISEVSYDTDGVTSSFPVPFYFLANDHLRVWLFYEDTGAEVDLVLGSTFLVTGAGNPAGGTVTTSTAYPAGPKLRIERVVPITQETAYQRNDPFPERAHERALDKLTMICQQLAGFFGLLPGSTLRALLLGRNDVDGQGAYRARNNRIQDLADPIAEQDAVNRRSMFSFVTEYVDKAIAGVVGGFGWFLQEGIGAVFRTFQGKMRDQKDLRDFLGDNWAGGDATAGIAKAVAAVAGTGGTLTVTDDYEHTGPLVIPGRMTLKGKGGKIKFTIGRSTPSIHVRSSNVKIEDLRIEVNLTEGLGSGDGANGTAVTVGDFFYSSEPEEIRNVRLKGLEVNRTSGSWGGHVITVIGRVTGVYIAELTTVWTPGANKHANAILVHWGAVAPGPELPFTGASYHPNDIRIDDLTLDGHTRVFQLSSCYDVSVRNVSGTNIDRFGDVIPGDEANRYSTVEQKSLVGSNLLIEQANVSGLIADSLASIRVYGLGFSKFDLTAGGAPLINWLQYRAVRFSQIVLTGADSIVRVIDCQNASGSITFKDVDIRAGRTGIACRVLDGGRGVVFKNVTARQRIGYEIQNSTDVTIDDCEHAVGDRTGFVGDATTCLLVGRRVSSALASGVVPGSANLVLTVAFGQNLYPGSQILINGSPCRVRGTTMIRGTETTIPVEGVTVTATTGATVIADVSTRNVSVDKMVTSATDQLMVMTTAGGGTFYSGIKLLNSHCRRTEKVAITTANCEHVEVSGMRFDDGQAGDVTVGAGSTGVMILNNLFGLNATAAPTLLILSTDSGNCMTRDNLFDRWLTAPISQATQNSARTDAGQYNQFSGNKSTSGALLDNGAPNSYYELYRNRVIRAAAAPTTGTWKNGDRCEYITPTAGGKVGAVCTIGGNPGTWKEYGAIDA